MNAITIDDILVGYVLPLNNQYGDDENQITLIEANNFTNLGNGQYSFDLTFSADASDVSYNGTVKRIVTYFNPVQY
jgi:hypothetical protein